MLTGYLPIAIRGDHVVDTKLLANLLDTEMQSVRFKLLIGEVGHDHRGQTHETSGLVFLSISPTVTLLALLHAINRGFCCKEVRIK